MRDKLEDLQRDVVRVRNERNWGIFHSPKNVAVSLSVETSELLEVFTWKSDEESRQLSDQELEKVKSEIGDVLFNLVNLSEILGIDLLRAGTDKLKEIEKKYERQRFHGSAKKYNET